MEDYNYLMDEIYTMMHHLSGLNIDDPYSLIYE